MGPANTLLCLGAAVLATVVSGCASSPDDVWHGDTSFTAEEREAIEASADWIAFHVNKPVPIIVWDGAPAYNHKTKGIRRAYPDEDPYYDATVAGTGSEYGITIEPNCPKEHIAGLTAHEWGHAYGLVHHDAAGVMQPNDSPMAWSDADEAELAGLR